MVGVLAYELLVGSPPFEADTHKQTYKRIIGVDLKFPSEVAPDARDFIKKLLCKEPSERMGLKELNEHHWISKYRSSSRCKGSCSFCK